MNLLAGFVVGGLGSTLIWVFKPDWSRRLPVAQVIFVAYVLNTRFPENYLATAIGCVASIAGWLVFLWAEKLMGSPR